MVVFPAPDKPDGEKTNEHKFPLKPPLVDHKDHTGVTSEPDGAASEASSGAHDLPSLASTDMVGLVHHVGWSL